MLWQEREVIAIEALVALGRVGDARARASRHFRAAPDTAHRPRIEVLLDAGGAKAREPRPRPPAEATADRCGARAAGLGNPVARADSRSRASRHPPTKDSPMKKFLVLYKASQSAFEQMSASTPEQQKAGMEAWMAWSKKAAGSIVDMGAPLGKSLRVTKSGASPATNDLGGFSILQAESKEALAEALKGHPHFMMPDGFIEVVELMPIPGM
jgi:hypothetical protein